MKASESHPSVSTGLTPVNTTTRTDVAPTTDSLAVSHTFVTRGRASQQSRSVEEDSTDIFLLERCSPLNDF